MLDDCSSSDQSARSFFLAYHVLQEEGPTVSLYCKTAVGCMVSVACVIVVNCSHSVFFAIAQLVEVFLYLVLYIFCGRFEPLPGELPFMGSRIPPRTALIKKNLGV